MIKIIKGFIIKHLLKTQFLLLITSIYLHSSEVDFKNFDGTAVILELNSSKQIIFGDRADEMLPPCSTFKILKSLISLETKVVKDENEIIKYDGTIHEYNEWNKDHSMQTAIKVSAVWFYQELAKRVGKNFMEYYIKKANYGNKNSSKNLTDFWLENGSLKISAKEQIEFLSNFVKNRVPFSIENINIVKKIIKLDTTPNSEIYGKTGSCGGIGWFVGFDIVENNTRVFAFNIKGKNANGLEAKKIALKYLQK